MTDSPIRVERNARGDVATLLLDDPARRNALSNELVAALAEAFATLERDVDVRCIVLRSADPRTFSAGGNLARMSDAVRPLQQFEETAGYRRLLQAFLDGRKPLVCAAQGHVLAGAMGLLLACDLVVATDTATFGTPEINVGVFPFQVSALLYRNVPRKFATELLLLGERLSAADAQRLGLVNRIVAEDAFDAALEEVGDALAAKSPLLMRMGKEAIARQFDMATADALDYLHHRLTLALTTDDIREGVSAFFEKREPAWTGG